MSRHTDDVNGSPVVLKRSSHHESNTCDAAKLRQNLNIDALSRTPHGPVPPPVTTATTPLTPNNSEVDKMLADIEDDIALVDGGSKRTERPRLAAQVVLIGGSLLRNRIRMGQWARHLRKDNR